ncbi:MAG: hypothetical protein KDM91_08645 [Verrucomicrobiae bacterium]|nr:hypothetical protein [Verrucomicrobiae bacterium]MCP5551836.1 hypothetical protein [Akkermansiaceae bacterium]
MNDPKDNQPIAEPDAEAAPSPRRVGRISIRFVLWLVGIFVGLFLLMILMGVISLAGRYGFLSDFFTGWYRFIARVLPGVTWNGFGIAHGVVALALAVGGFHYLATVFSRPKRRWRWKWTAGFACAVGLLFGAAISLTGIVRAVGWLSEEPMALNYYRDDWPEVMDAIREFRVIRGRYPFELSEVKVKERRGNNPYLVDSYVKEWTYLPPPTDDDAYFLMSGGRIGGSWFVLEFPDGFRPVDDGEAARLMAEHLEKLAAAARSAPKS